jgi:PST family polysaccharide transporter
MVSKIQLILQKKDYRILLENLISLSTLQLLNNFLPLFTMPYLVRILGPGKYGIISLAQAIMQYLINFTDYGFNLTATRDISINRENKKKVNEIFTNVMVIKLIFMTISFLLLLVTVLNYEKFKIHTPVFLLTFGMVIGNVFIPNWFFQGIEKMKYITYINLVAKILFTILVFIFIKSKSDFILVPLFYTMGFITSGIMAIFLIFSKFKIKLSKPSFSKIIVQLKEGWYVFLSTFTLSLYTNTGVVVLGLVTNNVIVGYYAAGEKIIGALGRMLNPIQQALFPYMSKLTHNSKDDGIKFIKKVTLLVGGFTFILTVFMFLFSDTIITTVLGEKYINSIGVFKILSFSLFFQSIALIFGIQIMLSLGYKKAYSIIIFTAFILNIVLIYFLSIRFSQVGCAMSVLISQIFITISTMLYLKFKGVSILNKIGKTL